MSDRLTDKREYDEWEGRRRARLRKQKKLRKIRRRRRIRNGLFVLVFAAVIGVILWLLISIFNAKYIDLSTITAPEWIKQDFFDLNPYSRPGTKITKAKEIVIHYVANPATTARNNWTYFNNLKDQREDSGKKITSASSHFIIGLDGEILQGIPLDEIAYATSKEKNVNTISIECCHPDETGEFTKETYESLVKLTAWLCDTLDLTERDVIRHYDATGKDCPRYFVANEEEWKLFKRTVKKALREIKIRSVRSGFINLS